MHEQDLQTKISQVIEATLLPIIQQQQEKIEKLEKLTQSQQQRIEKLEFDISQRNSIKRSSMINPTTNSSQILQKPDPQVLRTQQKKLEQEKIEKIEKVQNNDSKHEIKQIQKKEDKKPVHTTTAKEVIKKLPEPKKIEESNKKTRPVTGMQAKSASQKNLPLKKSDSQSPVVVKKYPKPTQQIMAEKVIESQTNQEVYSPEKIEKCLSEQEVSPQKQEFHDDIDLLEDNQFQEKEMVTLDIQYKAMTIESFGMIEMNFVGDLLSLKEVPDIIKQVVYVFLLTIGQQYKIESEQFWNDASQFMRQHEKQFPLFLDQIKERKYLLSDLEHINEYIEQHTVVIDPDQFENIDALSCALSYLIKDFHQSLKTIHHQQ